MKKLISAILTLALALTFACPALAAGEGGGFNAGLTIDRSVAGQISVTVADSSVLAEKRPTLTIPCDFDAAYVRFGSVTIASTLDTTADTISFTVAAGGLYAIIRGAEPPAPTPDPGPGPVTPTPAPAVTVPVSGEENSVSATATVENGTATVSIDDSSLADVAGEDVKTGDVTIDLTALNENVSAAVIPAESAAALADAASNENNDMTGLTVKLDTGDVTLDAAALETAAAAGEAVSVSVAEAPKEALSEEQKSLAGDRPVIDVTVLSGETPVSDLKGGSVTVSVPYTPAEGEDTEFITVWYLREDGSLEAYNCKYENGRLSFELTHLSKYIIGYFPFTDVAASKWYYGDVAYAYMTGLMNGVGGDRFTPAAATSRGMIVTILWRLEGKPAVTGANPFDDVTAGKYYENAVIWAAANGIVDGYGDGKFGPDDDITREQMAAILYRYANFKGYDISVGENTNILSYTDAERISAYAIPAMQWTCGEGLIQGDGGKLMPLGNATRAQVAAILHRFCENVK